MIPRITSQLGAYLHVIRVCEGTGDTDEGYRALFGWRPGNGKTFTSFADHPRQFFDYVDQSGQTIRTSAAGAYQATATTWDDFCRSEGKHDFSPASQDDFAAWLVWKCGAVDDVEAGRLLAALQKCSGRWASLPGSTVPQPHRDYGFCQAAFQAAGGFLDSQMPDVKPDQAPTEAVSTSGAGGSAASGTVTISVGGADNTNAIVQQSIPATGGPMDAVALPLIQALLPQVLGLFAPRIQAQVSKLTGGTPDASGAFLQALIAQIGAAVGIPIPTTPGTAADAAATQAVAKLTTSPEADKAALVQSLSQWMADYADHVTPVLDKIASYEAADRAATVVARDAASSRALAEKFDMTPWLVWLSGGTATLLVLGLAAAIVWQSIYAPKGIDGGLLGVAGPLLAIAMGVWREIFAYRFDGSQASNAAVASGQQVIDQLSKGPSQ